MCNFCFFYFVKVDEEPMCVDGAMDDGVIAVDEQSFGGKVPVSPIIAAGGMRSRGAKMGPLATSSPLLQPASWFDEPFSPIPTVLGYDDDSSEVEDRKVINDPPSAATGCSSSFKPTVWSRNDTYFDYEGRSLTCQQEGIETPFSDISTIKIASVYSPVAIRLEPPTYVSFRTSYYHSYESSVQIIGPSVIPYPDSEIFIFENFFMAELGCSNLVVKKVGDLITSTVGGYTEWICEKCQYFIMKYNVHELIIHEKYLYVKTQKIVWECNHCTSLYKYFFKMMRTANDV